MKFDEKAEQRAEEATKKVDRNGRTEGGKAFKTGSGVRGSDDVHVYVCNDAKWHKPFLLP